MTTQQWNGAMDGPALYQNRILPQLGADDRGRLVIIDIDTGDYEMDGPGSDALSLLLLRRPNARLWMERVGHPAAFHMGNRVTAESL